MGAILHFAALAIGWFCLAVIFAGLFSMAVSLLIRFALDGYDAIRPIDRLNRPTPGGSDE